jgi:uncharacterized protein YutE (UPF0331/DUF86 family)
VVDKALIYRKVSELELYLKQIQEFSELSADRYLNDWKIQRIVERTLQMMIETCVDVASHLVSDRGMRTPASYADTFKVLSENSIIAEELCVIMERMAKFRNVVVHQYEQVDADIVVLILKKHLQDFERYRDAVLEYLKNY